MANEKSHFLIDAVLKRIDFYTTATNSKAVIILGVNTFILGSVVLKYDILTGSVKNQCITVIIIGLSVLAMIGCVLSLYFILNAIVPFIKTGNKPGEYHSLLFYESIAEMEEKDYIENSKIWLENSSINEEDILKQCYILSKGLKDKHKLIRYSTKALLFGVMIPLLLILVIRFINYFGN